MSPGISRSILAKWIALHQKKEKLYCLQESRFIPVFCDFDSTKRKVSFHMYNLLIRLKEIFNLKYRIDIDNDQIKKNFHFILQKINEQLMRPPQRKLGSPFPPALSPTSPPGL